MESSQAEEPEARLAMQRAEHRDEALDLVGVELESVAVQWRDIDEQRDMQPAGRRRCPRHRWLIRERVVAVRSDQVRRCRRGQQRRARRHFGGGLPVGRTDPALPVSHQPIDLVPSRADREAAWKGGSTAFGGDVRDVKILVEVDGRCPGCIGRLDSEQDAQAVPGVRDSPGGHLDHIPRREL